MLKPNGRLVAATNGDKHMKELTELVPEEVRKMAASLRIRGDAGLLPFRLENGLSLLEPYFETVEMHLYDDCPTHYRSRGPLLAYAFSMIQPGV